MKLIFGGVYQGKLKYAKSEFKIKDEDIFNINEADEDLSAEALIEMSMDRKSKMIYGMEEFSRRCVAEGKEAAEILADRMEDCSEVIFVAADISQGLVPMEKEQRAWREMNGRMLIYLSEQADQVVRIFCGLPAVLKGRAPESSKVKSYIHLIRHGMTQGNVMKWYYGITDLPLLEEGIADIEKLEEEGVYPKIEGADFYTSGLLRTEQTLKLIFGDVERQVLKGFGEMNFGDFECKSYEDLKENPEYQNWIKDESLETKAPKGESFNEFKERVFETLQNLLDRHRLKELSVRHSGKECHSVVVCHGGVIGTLMIDFFREEDRNFFQWIPEPGRGYSLVIEGGVPVGYEEI